MIAFTDAALAEAKRLRDQNPGRTYLRLGVSTGGCSGLQYSMDFEDVPGEKDQVFEYDGLHVVCDARSYLYLNGITVDFSRSLVGGGFKFNNPNAAKSCSCGTSFKV